MTESHTLKRSGIVNSVMQYDAALIFISMPSIRRGGAVVQRRSKVRAVLLDYNGGDSCRRERRLSEEILTLVAHKDKKRGAVFFFFPP